MNKTKKLTLLALVVATFMAFSSAIVMMMPSNKTYATDTTVTTVTTEAELSAALAAGGEVALGGDIEVTAEIEISADITATLDLAGHAITSGFQTGSTTKHIYPLSNYGTLTIKDSVGAGSITGRGIYNQSGATMTVNGAKIVAEDWNGGSGIWGYGADSKVYLNNATIIGNTGCVSSQGYLEINGGTYTCYSGIADDGTQVTAPTYNIRAYNGLKITDGTFTSRHAVISLGGGTGVIEDGSYTIIFTAKTTSNVVYTYNDADLTINGGEFLSDNTSGKADSGAAVLVSGDSSKLTVNAGTYVGMNGMISCNDNTVINGGSFDTVWDSNAYGEIGNYVATGAVVTVGGETTVKNEDGTTTTVVAKIGDTTYKTFDEAITAANAMTGDVTVEIYGKVEYTDATASLTGTYDKITFVGKTSDAEISITRDGSNGYISGEGNDCAVVFEDLILSKPTGAYANDAGFMNVYFSVYRVGSVSYTNCTFPDGACAAGKMTVTYTDCEFANQTSGEYSLWVYSPVNCIVEKSEFTGVRGAKMYGEGAAATCNLTLSETVFTESVTQKPAIVLTYGESVTLEGNTYPTKGTFELDLDGAPNGTAVTSTDAITCVNDNGACGVLVDGKIYTTVEQAAAVATEGSTVTLLHNSTETVELAEGVTLDKNGYTAANVTVKVSVPTSTLTKCYTSESGYWGECGGNAKESFVFKFYNGDTYMGYTSLNNVGGIINGDVYVSWNIKLDTESNTDEYWTMAWEVQPTIAMQPTRVEHWVDGVKAGEAAVEPNWADSLYPIVAAVTDADGKILSYVNNRENATLENAIANVENGQQIVLLDDITISDVANAVNVTGGASFTLDFNGHTLTANTTNAGLRININNDAVTAPVIINVKNGTINADASAYCALIAAGKSEDVTLTVNVENMTMTNCHSYGFAVKAFAYSTVNLKTGTSITSNDGQGGAYALSDSTINVYEGVAITQKDSVDTYMGANLGVSGTGVLNVHGGTFTSDKYNINVMSSGGTANVYGGTFTSTLYGVHVDSWDATIVAPSVANISGGTFTAPTVVWVGANEGEQYRATANITGGTFSGKLDGTYGGEQTVIAISGGTFSVAVADEYLKEGYAALPNLSGGYVVGVKPTATVNNMGSAIVSAGDYMVYGNGDNTADMPLSFVMQFLADQTEEDMANSPYANWYGDFVITFTGIENESFIADGCYLAGHYGSFGWVKVPVDGMKIENDVRYPVMLGVGMGQKYDYICSSVEDFKCALYLTPEILAANPNLKVTLELCVVDNSKGEDAAAEALTNNASVYNVVDDTYEAEEFVTPVASIDGKGYRTLAEAFAAVEDGQTIKLLDNVELTETLTLNTAGTIIIDGNGKTITLADSYVKDGNVAAIVLGNSGWFDDNSANYNYTIKNVTFDNVKDVSVFRVQGVTLSVVDSTVQNCANTLGNGLFRIDYSNATFDNVQFLNNTAISAIALGCNINANTTETLTVKNSTFSGNEYTGTALIVAIVGDNAIIAGNEFVNNKSTNDDGNAVIYSSMNAEITGNYFSGNTLAGTGANKAEILAGPWTKGEFTIVINENAFVGTNVGAFVEGWSELNANTSFDLDGNYWNGGAPNYGQSGTPVITLDTYYKTANYTDGVLTLTDKETLPKGEIAYRAYVKDSEDREAIQVDLKNVYAKESLIVKLYDANGNLLTTTSLKEEKFVVNAENYTVNIVLKGTASSSWETDINAEKLTVANAPAVIKLYADGVLVDEYENALGAGTGVDETAKYYALDCVYKEAKIGETYYATFKDAINAVNANETIMLLSDVEVAGAASIKLPAGVTIDGAKYAITFESIYHGAANAVFYSDGAYTVKNLTVKLTDTTTTGFAFDMTNGGALENVVVDSNFVSGVYADNGVTITNCVFNTATSGSYYGVYAQGKVTVTGSEFNGNRAAILYGEAVFTNNEVNGDKGVSLATTNAVVTGNTFNGARALSISGNVDGTATITNNNFGTGTIEVDHQNSPVLSQNYWNGGMPADDQIIPAEEGYVIGVTVGSYYTDADLTNLETIMVAAINGTEYATLVDALNAAVDGDTITILNNFTLKNAVDASTPTSIAKNVTIDLNGKTIKATGHMFRIEAEVTFKNGTLDAYSMGYNFFVGKNASGVLTKGTLNIESGTYIAQTSVISVTAGVANVYDGEFSVVSTSGTKYLFNCVDSRYPDDANVVVKGGSFHGFNPQNNTAEGENTNFLTQEFAVEYVDTTDVYNVVPAVAAIGNVGYATLEDAVNAAASAGETITLIENITVTEKFTLNGVNLDLNGKTMYLKTTGNQTIGNVTISNGTIDVSGNELNGNSFFVVGGTWAEEATLNLDGITLTGKDYTTEWAVICVHNGKTLNITDSAISLENDLGSKGGFIKDTSGVGNTAIVNITNTKITLANVDRGFTGAKLNLTGVELTITGGEHGINGSELTATNSTITISGGTGRGITLSNYDSSIINSTVTLTNMGEGAIRFKTGNTLTVDDKSTLAECTAHADAVDLGANVNGHAVTGTEDEMSTVTVANGVTTVINPAVEGANVVAIVYDGEADYLEEFVGTFAGVLKDIDNLAATETIGSVIITLNGDVTTTDKIDIKYTTYIHGEGHTITYTGTERAIEVQKTAEGKSLIIDNLTINAEKAQRGITYNTTGKLALNNVNVTASTYAINFPSASNGAIVEISNSTLTANIALNIWGENMVINVTKSDLTSVDKSASENYAAIILNNNVQTVAEGTKVNVTGGSITALDSNGEWSVAVSNATSTGTVTISAETKVTGYVREAVALVNGYSVHELQEAFDYAASVTSATITLIRNANLTESIRVLAGSNVTLDLNGFSITYDATNWAGSDALIEVCYGANLIITDGSSAATGLIDGSVGGRVYTAIKMTYSGDDASKGDAVLTINGGTIKGYYYGIAGNGGRNGTAITINGGSVIAVGGPTTVAGYPTDALVGNAIFHPQDGVLTVTGGTISGPSGIEMRAGSLVITGGTITATGSGLVAIPNTSGNTVYGAAVALSQHNTAQAVRVEITGGTLKGVYAFYQGNLKTNGKSSTDISATIDTVVTLDGTVAATESGYAMTAAEDGSYALTYTAFEYKIYTLTLDGTIGINFYVDLSAKLAADKTAYATLSIDDVVVEKIFFSTLTVSSNGYYKLSTDLMSYEMNKEVTVTIYSGETGEDMAFKNTTTKSIRDYAMQAIELHTDEDTENYNNPNTVALMKSMLNYGAQSQIYFSKDVEDLANNKLVKSDQSIDTAAGTNLDNMPASSVTDTKGDEVDASKVALMLESATSIRIYLNIAEGVDVSKFTVTGASSSEIQYREIDGSYYVEIEKIMAYDIDTNFTIEIKDGDNTVIAITYSVMKYIGTTFDYGSENMKTLAMAMNIYNQAANVYFNK